MTRLLLAAFLLPSLLPGLGRALAEGHAVTVVNSGGDTIRRIEIGNGENRLRSQLPPGATARITYSQGCNADIRLTFDGGRTETFTAIDPCTDPRVVTGQGVIGHGPAPGSGGTSPVSTQVSATTKSAAAKSSTPVVPPPVVPPWTGKSITKRFGGMD